MSMLVGGGVGQGIVFGKSLPETTKTAPAGPLTATTSRLSDISDSLSNRLEEFERLLTRIVGPCPPYNHGPIQGNAESPVVATTVQALGTLVDRFADIDTTLSQHIDRLRGAL